MIYDTLNNLPNYLGVSDNLDTVIEYRFESHINRVIRSQIIKYIAGSVTGNRDSGTIYSESIYNVMLIRSKSDRQRFMLFPGW